MNTTHQVCPSCSGCGLLATSHHCASCGSQLSASGSMLANQTSVVRVESDRSVPAVIPVGGDHSEAYLTQRTSSGYVTQPVNVVTERQDAVR